MTSSMRTCSTSASNANTFASIMGPVIGNIGNMQFVLTAVFGGYLSIIGVGGITLGVMASYLQFTKSFTQPFMQVAQQFNSIIMALAGADRIFNMMDEEPEVDDGYVTLVNAKRMRTAISWNARSAPACGRGSIPTRRTAPSPIPS